MDSNSKLTLSVPELANELGISRPTAYQLVHRSDFPSINIGRRILIPMEQLKVWLEKNS